MIKDHLIDWMPDYYAGRNTRAIQEARETELQTCDTSQERLINDMYPSTAEDIELWENEYELSGHGSIQQRQENVVAYLRGIGGPATKETIIALVNAYTGAGDAQIEEYPDEFVIKVICSTQAAADFENIEGMLYRIIPAHVSLILSLNNTHGDLTRHTHGQMHAYTHEEL